MNDTDLATLAGSNTFTGATNTFNNIINLPARTASKLLLTDASKNVVSSTFTDTDLATKASPAFTGQITMPLGTVGTPSLSFTGDLNTGIFSAGADTLNFVTNATTRLSVSNSGVNVPNLTASKIVLTDASDNLVSSAYTDTDILNNSRIETFPRATCSALLTYTNQRAYYSPIIVEKTMTYSSISFGFQIPAGATISASYMGTVAYCIYNTQSLTTTNAYLSSVSTNAKVSGTDSGLLPVVLTNTPSTKSANTLHTFTFASPVSLTAGQYFLATLFQTASFSSAINVGTATFASGSTTMTVNSLNNGLLLGQGAILPCDVSLSPTQTFTGTINNGGALSGTVLTVTVAPTQYNIFIGQYIFGGSISGGTKIISFGSGTGGLGTYNVSISQLINSTSISSASCRLQTSGGADLTISTGQPTGRTGTYTLSSAFLGTTGISSATSSINFSYNSTANPFTVMNYSNTNLSTQNYCFEQSSLSALPASPTLSSSSVIPYIHIQT